MSEGPYKTVPFHGADSDGYSEVVDSNGRVAYTTDEESARQVCKELNLAHAHATDAAARRVRELEEALRVASTMCVKCFGRGTYSTGCPCIDDPRWEPDYHNCGAYDAECDDSTCVKVRAALAGKERSDGAN